MQHNGEGESSDLRVFVERCCRQHGAEGLHQGGLPRVHVAQDAHIDIQHPHAPLQPRTRTEKWATWASSPRGEYAPWSLAKDDRAEKRLLDHRISEEAFSCVVLRARFLFADQCYSKFMTLSCKFMGNAVYEHQGHRFEPPPPCDTERSSSVQSF